MQATRLHLPGPCSRVSPHGSRRGPVQYSHVARLNADKSGSATNSEVGGDERPLRAKDPGRLADSCLPAAVEHLTLYDYKLLLVTSHGLSADPSPSSLVVSHPWQHVVLCCSFSR